MNINIVCENFWNYRNLGQKIFSGGEVLLYEYASRLVEKGHKVTVIQCGPDNASVNFNGINIRQIKTPDLRLIQRAGLVRRWHWAWIFLRKHIDKDADWVHFHHLFIAFPWKSWKGITTGLSHGIDWDVTDTYRNLSLKNIRDRLSFWLLRYVTKRCIKIFDKVWSNDQYFMHWVMSTSPELRGRLVHIPNFADIEYFHGTVKKDESITTRFRGKKIVLLPKLPSFDRGTDIAIRAIKMLDMHDVVLIIAGDSSETDFFKKYAIDRGLHSDQVCFLGHKDHFLELPGLYAAADVVIIPSPWREATAISMLEGMAMEKPVIVTNTGGMTEVAIDRFNALVINPVDMELADAIKTVIENPDLASYISKNASSWIRQFYTKEIWHRRVSAFFEK